MTNCPKASTDLVVCSRTLAGHWYFFAFHIIVYASKSRHYSRCPGSSRTMPIQNHHIPAFPCIQQRSSARFPTRCCCDQLYGFSFPLSSKCPMAIGACCFQYWNWIFWGRDYGCEMFGKNICMCVMVFWCSCTMSTTRAHCAFLVNEVSSAIGWLTYSIKHRFSRSVRTVQFSGLPFYIFVAESKKGTLVLRSFSHYGNDLCDWGFIYYTLSGPKFQSNLYLCRR